MGVILLLLQMDWRPKDTFWFMVKHHSKVQHERFYLFSVLKLKQAENKWKLFVIISNLLFRPHTLDIQHTLIMKLKTEEKKNQKKPQHQQTAQRGTFGKKLMEEMEK